MGRGKKTEEEKADELIENSSFGDPTHPDDIETIDLGEMDK